MHRITILFAGTNQVELSEDAAPNPQAGELLVRATRTLISSGTESIVLSRNFAPDTHWDRWVKYPFHPGYSHVGRVIAVGDGVQGWRIGDRVASRSRHSSHVIVNAERAVRIPDQVSDEEAAWMALAKIAQIGVRAAEHRLGDCVAVVGLGPLGQLVVQYARLMGAGEVIAVDPMPPRLDIAARHGATHTIAAAAGEALQQVKHLTAGRGADVVYDVTGHPAVFATALPLARQFGTVVLLGDTGNPQHQTLTSDVIRSGLRIVGAHDSHPHELPTDHARWSGMQMYELIMTYLARRQLRLADLITHRFPPTEAPQAYDLLQRHREQSMGVIFDWTEK